MPRVDKTHSAVGVTRAPLNADVASGSWNTPLGVGINSAGKAVIGAGQTGIVGVAIFDKTNSKAGLICDIFSLAELDLGPAPLAAGRVYWADGTTGVLAAGAVTTGAAPGSGAGSTAGSARVGYTIETDRLKVSM